MEKLMASKKKKKMIVVVVVVVRAPENFSDSDHFSVGRLKGWERKLTFCSLK